jgi:hypothetical protein
MFLCIGQSAGIEDVRCSMRIGKIQTTVAAGFFCAGQTSRLICILDSTRPIQLQRS